MTFPFIDSRHSTGLNNDLAEFLHLMTFFLMEVLSWFGGLWRQGKSDPGMMAFPGPTPPRLAFTVSPLKASQMFSTSEYKCVQLAGPDTVTV